MLDVNGHCRFCKFWRQLQAASSCGTTAALALWQCLLRQHAQLTVQHCRIYDLLQCSQRLGEYSLSVLILLESGPQQSCSVVRYTKSLVC